VARSYAAQKQLGGSKWEPLQPSTKAHRRFPGKPILVQTGRLKRSIHHNVIGVSRGGLGSAVLGPGKVTLTRISPERVGSRRSSMKARVHQFGTDRSGPARTTSIPARPYLGLSEQNIRRIREIFSTWIRKQLQKQALVV